MVSDLEFAQLQLHQVLVGWLNEDSGEQLGVWLHLKGNTSGFNAPHCNITTFKQIQIAFPYLVKGVYLLSIGCKGHETGCQINQAANNHVLLAEAGLLIADQVPSPHHITVTVLHAAEKKQNSSTLKLSVVSTWKEREIFFLMWHMGKI